MALDKNKVKENAEKLGADAVGVGNVERMNEAPPGHKPSDYLKDAKSIIAVAVRINYSAVEGLPKTRREYVNAGDAAGTKLNRIIYELARYIEDEGFSAMPFLQGTDYNTLRGDLSLKHAAVAAGIGEFGLNNLVLTPKYGPRVLVGAIITNAQFEPDPLLNEKLCDLCKDCIEICPVDALRNPQGYDRMKGWTIDKTKCYHYVYRVLEPTYGHFSCGMCIKACHVGKAKK